MASLARQRAFGFHEALRVEERETEEGGEGGGISPLSGKGATRDANPSARSGGGPEYRSSPETTYMERGGGKQTNKQKRREGHNISVRRGSHRILDAFVDRGPEDALVVFVYAIFPTPGAGGVMA